VDEQKSWKRLIFAYVGAGVLVLAIAFFIARSASQNTMMVAHAAATQPPSTVGVYSGIAPDATPEPKPAAASSVPPSPSPEPSASASADAHPSDAPTPKPAQKVALVKASAPHKHVVKNRPKEVVADASGDEDANANAPAGHIIPIVHPSPNQALAPKPVASPVVEQATESPATPAPAPATEAPAANAPIFEPQRIVDAQVRVAVQPEYTETDRARGAHGQSVVLVTIDPKGNVVSASIGSSSGYTSLDHAAMSAAKSSQFVAPKINGRPATETYRVVYDFSP